MSFSAYFMYFLNALWKPRFVLISHNQTFYHWCTKILKAPRNKKENKNRETLDDPFKCGLKSVANDFVFCWEWQHNNRRTQFQIDEFKQNHPEKECRTYYWKQQQQHNINDIFPIWHLDKIYVRVACFPIDVCTLREIQYRIMANVDFNYSVHVWLHPKYTQSVFDS